MQIKEQVNLRYRTTVFLCMLIVLFSHPITAQTTPTTANNTAVPAGPATGADNKVIITPERLLAEVSGAGSRRSVGAFRWLPDSKHVVFGMADPSSDAGRAVWIYRMNIETGKSERLFQGANPKPSPDGSAIAFMSGAQLSVYFFEGGTVKNLVQLPGIDGNTMGFAWSPDSRQIAYGFRPVPPRRAETTERGASSAMVVGSAADVPPDSEVWVLDVATGSKQKLTSGPYLFSNPNWFLDGKAFMFESVGSFQYRTDSVTGKVLAASVPSGEVRTVIQDSGVQNLRPIVSPDGRQIGFTYDPNNVTYPYFWNIATMPVQGGPVRQLTKNLFVASGPVWAPDQSKIYFGIKDGAFFQICSVTMSGEVKRLTTGARNSSGVAVSPDGKYITWSTSDAIGNSDVRIASSDGASQRVLLESNNASKELALSPVEEIRWKSRDGLEIAGLLIKPLGHVPGKKYPLLVEIHGGPVGGISLVGQLMGSTPLEWQMWTAKGYAVLVPDYRSSEIPGWEPFLKAREKQDYNDRDMDDIMSGVDVLIQQGLADPEKLAMLGHSYGGIMVNWIITKTHRFKAAVSYEGYAENYIAYGVGLRVGGNSITEWLRKGKPWEVPENYRKNAAVEFVRGVKTPTLFINGDYSGGSGVENLYHQQFMYTALKKQGVDTQMVIYKGEGHAIQKPENKRDLLMRVIDWIDSHLK